MAYIAHSEPIPGWTQRMLVVRRWRVWYRYMNWVTTGFARVFGLHADFVVSCPSECPCCGRKMP
jgi:hypothetical protein